VAGGARYARTARAVERPIYLGELGWYHEDKSFVPAGAKDFDFYKEGEDNGRLW